LKSGRPGYGTQNPAPINQPCSATFKVNGTLQSIVATAIPRITDDFKSLDHVGWYGSVFFVTLAAFQSTWGGLYKYFSLKPVFITASAVFEIGSLLCGELFHTLWIDIMLPLSDCFQAFRPIVRSLSLAEQFRGVAQPAW
jgi:MFS family permease